MIKSRCAANGASSIRKQHEWQATPHASGSAWKPFDQKDAVTIDISAPCAPPWTYDLSLRETRYSAQMETHYYSGVFATTHHPLQTQEDIDQSPLGLFLDTWSIAKE